MLPAGSRCWQALSAARNRGVPSSCWLTFGIAPLLVGSGKFGTPCRRMQRAKASAFRMFDDGEFPRAFNESPAAADDGLLPYATAVTARLAVATMAATVRGVHARCSRAATRVLSFIIPSSWLDEWLAAWPPASESGLDGELPRRLVAFSASGFTLLMFARPR